MPEISDREQAPIFAVFDRPSVQGSDLIVRCQPLYHLPEGGYKSPPFFQQCGALAAVAASLLAGF
jgi:hypothetical protein